MSARHSRRWRLAEWGQKGPQRLSATLRNQLIASCDSLSKTCMWFMSKLSGIRSPMCALVRGSTRAMKGRSPARRCRKTSFPMSSVTSTEASTRVSTIPGGKKLGSWIVSGRMPIPNLAASVGQIDEERLFYLMSRGLDRKSAEKLVVEGFFDPIVRNKSYINWLPNEFILKFSGCI